MKALRNYLKKPLMAIFVGLLLFLWDHLILWPNGIFVFTALDHDYVHLLDARSFAV